MSHSIYNLMSAIMYPYTWKENGPFSYVNFRGLSGSAPAGPLDPNDKVFRLSDREKELYQIFKDRYILHMMGEKSKGMWPAWTTEENQGFQLYKSKVLPKACGAKFRMVREQCMVGLKGMPALLSDRFKPSTMAHNFSTANILEEIFGSEAVEEGEGLVSPQWNLILRAIYTSGVKGLRLALKRRIAKEETCAKAARVLVQGLKSAEQPSIAQLRKCIRTFGTLGGHIRAVNVFMGRDEGYKDDRTKELEEFHGLCDSMFSSAGIACQPSSKGVSGNKIQWNLADWTEEDVLGAWGDYMETFHADDQERDINEMDHEHTRQMFWNAPDFGTEGFHGSPLSDIYHTLGLAKSRSSGEYKFPFISGERKDADNNTVPLTLRWHQVGAVQKFASHFMSGSPRHVIPGLLIADEVGLGKTAQSFAMLAYLAHARTTLELWKQKKASLPPIFNGRTYFGMGQTIPDLPCLIIAPPNLITNWEREGRIWLSEKTMQVFVYHGTGRNRLFGEGSKWKTSAVAKGMRIVVASTSAITTDSSQYLKNIESNRPPTDNSEYALYDEKSESLFSQRWNVTIIDEVHEHRSPTSKIGKVLIHLTAKSQVALGLSATPLFTSPKDLVTIGRYLRIPGLGDDAGNSFRKRIMSSERAAATDARTLQEETPVPDDVESEAALELWRRGIRMKVIHQARMEKVNEGRTLLAPFMLRRSDDSLDNEGKNLLHLPQRTDITYLLNMYEDEAEALEKTIEDLSEQLQQSGTRMDFSGKLDTANFWVYLRMHGIHYSVVQSKLDNKPTWIPKSIEEWNARRSVKLESLVQLCDYYRDAPISESSTQYWRPHLDAVNSSSLVDSDGHQCSPDDQSDKAWDIRGKVCRSSGSVTAAKNQIPHKGVIYCMWPSAFPLVTSVLNLHGHFCSVLHGKTKEAERTQILDDFSSPGPHKDTNGNNSMLLLMSNVGSVGLNLPRATWLCFMDMPWGSGDVRQIRGRIRRQPQPYQTFIYTLLHGGTIEELMEKGASSKDEMLQLIARTDGKLKELVNGLESMDEKEHEEEGGEHEDIEATNEDSAGGRASSKQQARAEKRAEKAKKKEEREKEREAKRKEREEKKKAGRGRLGKSQPAPDIEPVLRGPGPMDVDSPPASSTGPDHTHALPPAPTQASSATDCNTDPSQDSLPLVTEEVQKRKHDSISKSQPPSPYAVHQAKVVGPTRTVGRSAPISPPHKRTRNETLETDAANIQNITSRLQEVVTVEDVFSIDWTNDLELSSFDYTEPTPTPPPAASTSQPPPPYQRPMTPTPAPQPRASTSRSHPPPRPTTPTPAPQPRASTSGSHPPPRPTTPTPAPQPRASTSGSLPPPRPTTPTPAPQPRASVSGSLPPPRPTTSTPTPNPGKGKPAVVRPGQIPPPIRREYVKNALSKSTRPKKL